MAVQQEGPLVCFSGGPLANGVFKLPDTNANALPDINQRGRLVFLRAGLDNTDPVFVGKSGLTITVSATNETTGIPLDTGDWFPFPIPAAELDQFYVRGTAGDVIHWMVMG